MINIIKKSVCCLSLLFFGCASPQKCPENINTLPMYGRAAKCEAQLEFDRTFFRETDSLFKDRQTASQYYAGKGWEYFYSQEYETSIKRFNQAWLLDSLNAEVYWGFGNILGINGKFQESLPLLEKSIKLDPNNFKVHECLATSYGQLFFQSKDKLYLDKTIESLKRAIKIEPNSINAHAQLTAAYSYFNQKDSAQKYLLLTDKLDPNAVNPEVRKILSEK